MKLNSFFSRLRGERTRNRMLIRFYMAVSIVMIQIIIAIVFLCKLDFLCANERKIEVKAQMEVFLTDNNYPYADFSPRLYKGRFFSNQTRIGRIIHKNKENGNFSQDTFNSRKEDKEARKYPDVKPNITRPYCPSMSPHLKGNIYTNTVVKYSFELLEKIFADLEYGGQYTPPDCLPRHKVAIIVPYRNRKNHLNFFFKHMHSFLRRQQVYYRIFVVESEPNSKFNKGLLFNAGYTEARKTSDFDCYIFHDVDLLPENDYNLYRCFNHSPRHLSVAVDSLNYTLSCDCYIGGVNAMTMEQMELINGYSNKFYGWGGEDDDLLNRIKTNKLSVSRQTEDIARYKMLSHSKRRPNPSRWKLLELGKDRWKYDGLNSATYNVLHIENLKLCTYVLIDYDMQDSAFKEEVYPDLQELEREYRAQSNRLHFAIFYFTLVIFFFILIVLIL